jgi:flagellar basal body rod protein FlgG
MHPALWISKTGLDAQQRDISVISNNLANASTLVLKKAVLSLKISCIRISINLVAAHPLIPNYPMV